MFSDRLRWLKMLLLGGALAYLAIHYGRFAASNEYGYWRAMKVPEKADGRSIHLSLVTVVDVRPDGYVVSKVERQVPILADPGDLEVGDTVSVSGHFEAERMMVVEDVREVHHLRPLKWAWSALTALLLFVYLPFSFRWREGRLHVHDPFIGAPPHA